MSRHIAVLFLCAAALSCDRTPTGPTYPLAPANVFAEALVGDISISWTPVGSAAKKYQIEYSSELNVWVPLAETAANVTNTWHRGVSYWVTYSYRVRACNDVGCSPWVEASATSKQGHVPIVNTPTVSITNTGAQTLGITVSVTVRFLAGFLPATTTLFVAEVGNDLFSEKAIDCGTVTPTFSPPREADAEPFSTCGPRTLYNIKPSAKFEGVAQVRNALGIAYSPKFSFSTPEPK